MKTKPTLRSFLTLTASTLLAISYTHAAILTWDPDGDAAAVNPASGTWSTTVGNLFWNNGGGVANVPWTTGNEAVFGGTGGPFAITVTAVTAQKITFASATYTLSGAANVTITPASGNPLLQVDSGAVATIGAGTNIIVANSANLGQATGSTAAGTLNIDGASAVIRPSNNTPGWGLSGNGFIVNVKNGTLRTSTTANGNSITVGAATGSSVDLNVSSGVSPAAGVVSVTGTGGLIVGGAGQGTVTQTGGSISMASNSTAGVSFAANAANASVNTFNLDGGTLTTPIVRKGIGASSTAVFNFNGGTLVANNSATNATFMQGLDAANVKAGGAIIQNASSITINQSLLAGSPSGGLTKSGAGTLILGGNNTYTGATTVNAGRLLLSTGTDTGTTSASDITIPTALSGGVFVGTRGLQHISSGDLTFADNSTLVIDYGVEELTADVAPLVVDNFTVGTGMTLLINGTVFTGTPYPLVSWTGTGLPNVNSFLPLVVNGLVGVLSISNNTLIVTFIEPDPISWVGGVDGNGTWDTTTSNWLRNGSPSTFVSLQDAVLFNDGAAGSGDPVVTLNSTVSPFGVNLDASLRNYTISGTGTIAGPAGLTLKSTNLARLTLTTANTYAGPTKVEGGNLRLGNGGSTGSLSPTSAISVSPFTAFEVNRDNTVTQGTDFGTISGGGDLLQLGTGTTILNRSNAISGTIAINAGNLEVGGTSGRLGSSGVFVGGISILQATSSFQYSSSQSQILDGAISGAGSLVKSGSGNLSLAAGNSYTGPTVVNSGTLSLASASALGGTIPGDDGTSAITLGGAAAATLSTTETSIVISAPITTANSGINSTIAFARNTAFQGNLSLNGGISGPGNVIFTSPDVGGSTNQLQTINLGLAGSPSTAGTWAGNTTISAGNTQVTLSVRARVPNALPVTTVLNITGPDGAGSGRTLTFDLFGNDQTLAGLKNTITGTSLRNQRVNNTGAAATLTINSSTDTAFGGSTTNGNARIVGPISLTKTGAAQFTLLGTHQYTGNTSVNQGTLVLSANNTSNDASTVTVASTGATLNLNFTGTDSVSSLVIGTTPVAPGVYGGPLSPAAPANQLPQLSGTGTLTVGISAVTYTSWAATNAGGQAPGLDFDNDGVPNGVEFFMNSAAGFTANPQLSTTLPRTISWPNGGNIPSSAYGTQFVVQTSPDLSTWTDVLIGDTNLSNTAGSVSYTANAGAPFFVRLKVTPN